MATARAIMQAAVTPSSTRHDWGAANSGASQRAPKPMAVNHSALAKAPPVAKAARPHVG